VNALSRWLNWTPDQPEIIRDSAKIEPSKPTKPSFDGFDGSVSGEGEIIRGQEPTPAVPEQRMLHTSVATQAMSVSPCPHALPEGVRLIRYEKKTGPVAVTVCSVITDVNKFIRHALGELDARLHSHVQIKAGDSAFDLLSKLADCGVELRLEWPPASQIICQAPEREPSKPTKHPEPPESNSHGTDITHEDLPF
jgi:hypothetical protein